MDIFEYNAGKQFDKSRPLAERMRPKKLDDFVGHSNITGEKSSIRDAIENDRLFSMILWGPPGCGKTTLARIIANQTKSCFIEFSAVLSGVKQIRSVIEEARNNLKTKSKRTILFVDEIHRFNKAQQDAFLPHVESGLITLIGATTENPSFEVINALMSRCRIITLEPLLSEDIKLIIDKALKKTTAPGGLDVKIDSKAKAYIAEISEGDARVALNGLEICCFLASLETDKTITLETVEKAFQKKAFSYDKNGESHYNLISALHKSMRGSDPDAALYWVLRMLKGGEDPFYILRRMVRFASEDVGNADPHALNITLGAMEAYRFLGSPEGDLAIAQAAIYLAAAPKSNKIYEAFGKAAQEIEKSGSLPVPMHIRNAPTRLMKDLGYGKGYKYPHDFDDAYAFQQYLPDKIKGSRFYTPSQRGYEAAIKKRLDLLHKKDSL